MTTKKVHKISLVKNHLALVKELLRKCEIACFGTQKCVLGGSEGSKHQKNAFFFAFLVTQGPTILVDIFFPFAKKYPKITAIKTLRKNRYSFFEQRSAF